MAEVLFTNSEYIKANTVINGNVDEKVLMATIKDAQNIHIHSLLGTKLYKKLQAEVEANIENSTPYTACYEELICDYILPCLTKWVQYELTYMNHFRYRDKGTQVKNSQFGQPANFQDLTFLMDRERDKAEHYGNLMVTYLQCNTDKFPEYCDNTEGGEIDPVNNAFTSNIYLGLENTNGKTYKDEDDYYQNL